MNGYSYSTSNRRSNGQSELSRSVYTSGDYDCHCAVLQCCMYGGTDTQVAFHRFPKDKDRLVKVPFLTEIIMYKYMYY